MKCHYCPEKAIIFDLPSRFLDSEFNAPVTSCNRHYLKSKDIWDRDLAKGVSTWSEEEYLEDALRVML